MATVNPNYRTPVNRSQPPAAAPSQTSAPATQGAPRVNPRYTQRMQENPPPRNVPPGTRWEGTNNRAYWENPQTVVRFHRMVQTAPPGWTPPDWMDVNKIETAYRYMQHRNNYRDPATWMWLPQDDPGRELTTQMDMPPGDAMTWWERQQYYPMRRQAPSVEESVSQLEPARPFGDWDNLKNWQQVLLGAFAPNTPLLQDRPEWTRVPGTVFQSALAGLGTAAGGAAIGSVIPGVGTAIGGLAGFGIGFAGTAYSTWTGKEVPLLSDVMRVFNIPAEWLEQVAGLGLQASKSGFDDVIENLPAAWEAGRATYETLGPGATNVMAPVAGRLGQLFGMEYDWNAAGAADPNQVWKFEQGIVDPVTLNKEEAAGLQTIRTRVDRLLNSGVSSEEAWSQVYAEVVDTYGFDGTFNDFVLQSILDPLNLVPFAEGKVGKVIAEKMGNPRLAAAFEASTGNPLVDALPFGVQSVVAWITKQKTSDGAFAAWDTYRNWVREGVFPREMMRLPADMDEQYMKLIGQGVDPKTITFSGKEMHWPGEDGTQQTFTGKQDAPSMPAAAALSDFEKWAAGLDKEGRIIELMPDEPGANYAKKVSSLNPMAKATIMLHTMHDQLNLLLSRAGGDPEAMIKMVKQMAGVEAYKAGDAGELMFKSPVAATIQAALRYAIGDGKLDAILSEWGFASQRRVLLQKVSEALGMRPADFLEALADRPDVITQRVNQVAPALGKPEFLQDTLAVFVGEDALPWNENQFQARVALALFDTMDDWLKDAYGLKPESGVFRLAGVLKGMQSLLLLGLNPAYFINNSVNNIATRAAVGVFGFMTPRQIDEFMTRFGITPSRMNEGVGAGGDVVDASLAGLRNATTADDSLAKIQKVVSSWNNKLGIFSRFSGKFEALESKQAYAIGIQRYFGANWKRGKGFSKMPAYLETALNNTAPGMAETIYRAVEAGMNQDEIERALFSSFLRPAINGIVDDVAAQVMPASPELLKDIINRQGIADELKKRLDNANTDEEIDYAFDAVETEVLDAIRSKMLEDLIVRAEDVRNQVGQEQIAGVLQLYGDMEIDQANRWISGRKEWEDLYARRDNMTEDQWTREVKALFAKQDDDWTRWRSHELQTIKGILQAMQIEGPDSLAFVDKMMAIHQTWREFHAEARKLRDIYFSQSKRKPGEKWEQFSARRAMLWTTLQDSLDDLYVKHYDVEKGAQRAMDDLFAKMYQDMTGWDPAAAGQWRERLRDMRYEMFHAQREMRSRTRNMTPIERDAAYAEFNPVYNRMIADMKKLEHDGAYSLARRAPPPADVNVPPARPDNMPEPPPPPQGAEFRPAVDVAAARNQAVDTVDDVRAAVDAARAADEPDTPGGREIMRVARASGVFRDDGTQIQYPAQRHVLNIINKGKEESGGRVYESLDDVPVDIAKQALMDHRNRHIADRAQAVAHVKGLAQQIMQEADADRRAAIAQKNGMLVRKSFRQQVEQAFNATQMEIDAVMVLTDMVADTWARRSNRKPDQATRDAWYAGHVSKVMDSQARGPRLDIERRLQQYGWMSPEDGARTRLADAARMLSEAYGIDARDGNALEAKANEILATQRTAMNGAPTDAWNWAYEYRQAFFEMEWIKKHGHAFDFEDYGELTRGLSDRPSSIPDPFLSNGEWVVEYTHEAPFKRTRRRFGSEAEANEWVRAYREGTYLYQMERQDAARQLFQGVSGYGEDLVAVHNLREDAFNFAHDFGGLAAPSIAIIKPDTGFDGFGEITLVARPGLVDPSQPRVFAYSSDAYTPRMPDTVYGKVKRKDYDAFKEKFMDYFYQTKLTSQWWRFDSVIDRPDYNQFYIDATNSPAFVQAYLSETGQKTLPLIMKPDDGGKWGAETSVQYEWMRSMKVLNYFRSLPHEVQLQASKWVPEGLPDDFVGNLRALVHEYYTSVYGPDDGAILAKESLDMVIDEEGGLYTTMFSSAWADYRALMMGRGATVDTNATMKKWKAVIDEDAFRAWVKAEMAPLFGEPKMRLGGRLVPYTMANAVKAMSKGEVRGGELGSAAPGGMSSAHALMSERLMSVDDMHQWAESIVTKAKLAEWIIKTGEPRMDKAVKAYQMLVGGGDKREILKVVVNAWKKMGERDLLDDSMDMDGKLTAILDAIREENNDTLPLELMPQNKRAMLEDLLFFAEALGNAPVGYFEAKVMRPVDFKEFAYALVPDTISPSTIDKLKGYGMEVVTYFDGERNAALANLPPSVLFQDASSPSAARASVDFIKDGRAIIHAMNQPNVSSIVHEISHIFRRDLPEKDMDAMAKLGGLEGADELRALEQKFWTQSGTDIDYKRYRDAEELFARGWERYLAEGDAPTPQLRSLFKTFSNWMLTIYRRLFRSSGTTRGFREQAAFQVNGQTVDIRATVDGISLRDIFDRMLVEDPDRPRTLEEKLAVANDRGAVIDDILSPYQDADDAMRAAAADPYDPANREILEALDYADRIGHDPFEDRPDPADLRASQQAASDLGRPVNLDDIRDASTLHHDTTLPDVARDILARAERIFADESPAARKFVADYISHRISGSTTTMSRDGYGMTENVMRSLSQRVDDALGTTIRGAAELLNKPVRISPAEVPAKGLYAGRIYTIMHGDQKIVSAVYNDGKLVALVPDTLRNFDVRDGVRTLGMDPDNPSRWVMQAKDGKIYSYNPDAPKLDQAPDYGLMAGRKQVEIPAPGKLLRDHDFRQANRTIDELVLHQNDDGTIVDLLKWQEPNQRADIFGTVNNRLFRELESVEALLGYTVEGTFTGPGRTKGSATDDAALDPDAIRAAPELFGKKLATRTIRARDLFLSLVNAVENGTMAELVNPNVPIEVLISKRNFDVSTKTGEARARAFQDNVKALREDWVTMHADPSSKEFRSEMILTKNGKAGQSIDFILGTCQPTTPCRECYAAGIVRQSVISKSVRNTILMLMDPEAFGRKAAAEVMRQDRISLPYLRLLGSGDLTSSKQVDAFNTIAQNIDRPIHIFSRHHDNLAKLVGTQKAPFIKMGSIDADLYNYYGPDVLATNMASGGINNAFLFTDPSEIPMIMDLHNRDALGLVLSASHDLHEKLPYELRVKSCPCDAGERSYFDSCRQCALSGSGCYMVYVTKMIDTDGKIWDARDPNVPETAVSLLRFTAGIEPPKGFMKARADAKKARVRALEFSLGKSAGAMIRKSVSLATSPYMLDLKHSWEAADGILSKKGKEQKVTRVSVPLKDLRWPDDVIELVDIDLYLAQENAKRAKGKNPKPPLTEADLVSTENRRYMKRDDIKRNFADWVERMQAIAYAAETEGTFYLPGGEIQLPVEYQEWRKIPIDEQRPKEDQRPILLQDTESKEFVDWFGDSKVRDEDGEPLRVFHGSTHVFDAFDQNKVSIEGYYGSGFYFTSDVTDASKNYAGIGPDLRSRIDSRAEEILQEWIDDGADVVWGTQKYSKLSRKAERQAEAELVGEAPDGVILPVYLSIENPFDWDNTKLEVRIEYDEDGNEIGDPTGNGWDLLNAIEDVLRDNGYEDVAEEHRMFVQDRLLEEMLDGGMPARRFDTGMRNSFDNGSLYDQETGKYATGEFMRQVYERAGFDGIIMNAGAAFPHMPFAENAKHIIAFKPTQIKSTFNAGTWSKTDANILHQVVDAGEVSSSAFDVWFGDSKVVDKNGAPQVVFHGTENKFETFDPSMGGSATGVKYPYFFFTSKRGNAQFYGPKVMKVYLSMQNPFIVDDANRAEFKRMSPGMIANEIQMRNFEADGDVEYDGVIVRDTVDGSEPSDIFVAFEPTQIKSVKNTGSWSVENPNILYQTDGIDDLKWAKEVSFRDAPQTAAFRNFFAGSKVVDEDGQPLRVFHGTRSTEEFDAFNLRTGDIGIHFGSAGQANDRLAFTARDSSISGSKRGRDDRVIAGYINIKNPLRVPDMGLWNPDNLGWYLTEHGKDLGLSPSTISRIKRARNAAQIRTALKDAGYDGIVYRNTGEVEGGVAVLENAEKKFSDGRAWDEFTKFREDNATDSFIIFDPRQFKAENNAGEFNPRDRRMLHQDEPRAMGEAPLNGTPVTQPEGRATEEMYLEQVRPAMAKMRQAYKDGMRANTERGPIDQATQRSLRGWVGGVKQEMANTKHQAMIYGQQMRDSSLLNYNRRYGADNLANLVVPYQFWYTRSMLNWAKRMVDRPAWFAMYARLAEAQKRMERKGMPSRLSGKSRIAMPWMPDWMGGGLWQDPWSKILPFATFGQPLEQFAMDKQQISRRTEQILQDLVESGDITEKERAEAMTTQAGEAWKNAYAQAQVELDKSASPTSLVSLMFQPALWWTIPTNIANGTPEKISPMPITRFGQGIRSVGRGTAVEPLTNLAGSVLAGPEEAIRRQVKLSEFGEWGDYYIDKHLAAMAADGSADPDEVVLAMIERTGPVYEEAKRRTSDEIALRQPGFAGLMAAREGGTPAEILSSTLTLVFGGGSIFPDGELKFRNLKADYDMAWRALENGDEEAINRFFEENPEYAGRLALYKEPEERLRSFLTNAIWEGYFAMDKANRQQAIKAMGPEFEERFLNSETRSIEGLDVRTLASWAQALGKQVPETAETAWRTEIQPDYWDQGELDSINAYKAEKDQLFPNIGSIQSTYFNTPEGAARKQLLLQFPELKEYWSWKDQYAIDNPDIVPYFDELKQSSQGAELSSEITSPLARQLMGYTYGQKLSDGAVSEIRRLWGQFGDGMEYEEFLAMLSALAMSMQ